MQQDRAVGENPEFWRNWENSVIQLASEIEVAVLPEQAQQMAVHARELLCWNRKINLTAITDPSDMALNHYVDSLAISPVIGETVRIMDLGSGAGFPGIPLKIHKPSLKMFLVDASRKKINFLKHIIRQLNLTDTRALHIRIQHSMDCSEFDQCFDVVVSRAFSSLQNFFELAHRLVLPTGQLIAMKGVVSEDEIAALRDALSRTRPRRFATDILRYRLPSSSAQRSLVRILVGG
jgi:16S rRNA (guanine527-N7)-methyltransferase